MAAFTLDAKNRMVPARVIWEEEMPPRRVLDTDGIILSNDPVPWEG